MGSHCTYTLEDIKELNANFDQVISANHVPRNDKNVVHNNGVAVGTTMNGPEQTP